MLSLENENKPYILDGKELKFKSISTANNLKTYLRAFGLNDLVIKEYKSKE
jgi:hypothetical protein